MPDGGPSAAAARRRLAARRARAAHRARSCEGKIRYVDMEAAEAAASELHARDGAEMRGYRCEHCVWHHVGHAPAWLLRKEAGGEGQRV